MLQDQLFRFNQFYLVILSCYKLLSYLISVCLILSPKHFKMRLLKTFSNKGFYLLKDKNGDTLEIVSIVPLAGIHDASVVPLRGDGDDFSQSH